MPAFSFNESMLEQISERGTTPEVVLNQLDKFRTGIPFISLDRPATLGDGILNIDNELSTFIAKFEDSKKDLELVKFVPASGAASRMFKDLIAAYNVYGESGNLDRTNYSREASVVDEFISNIEKFAFYNDLKTAMSRVGLDLEVVIESGDYRSILEYVLEPNGLDYKNLPKGLIEFHKYGNTSRTAFEEHLVEAGEYAVGMRGVASVQFTLSPAHRDVIVEHISHKKSLYESDNINLTVSYSEQLPSTDTIAADIENNPFIDDNGNLVFRPGGHGALLSNINELDTDIVFIKNIDNVVPDRLKGPTADYKKALAGYLLDVQHRVYGYLEGLCTGDLDSRALDAISQYCRDTLKIGTADEYEHSRGEQRVESLINLLNRPIRVCGVVRNVGEPGGGPFWVRENDGTTSLQIVESSQIDPSSQTQLEVLRSSTHFNPVDIVCGMRDFRGSSFDLMSFIDPDTGFISNKSYSGRELRALELPGLWNGAMSRWITIFVEVPAITFNPVKTVMDLLRTEHQPE